jgi:PAS domain S-box-containing protein
MQDGDVGRESQAIRRSDATLRDFIGTLTIGLHLAADGTILWANQAELDPLGYPREAFIGRNIAEFHTDKVVIEDILGRLSRGEVLSEYPARLRHRDGSIRYVLINSSAATEEEKFIHTRCFARDVTALQKEPGAGLLLLSAIVDSSDDAIISKDLTGRITSWNGGAERIFGYTAQEAVGQSITMLIPDDRQGEERDILACLQRGESINHFETIRCHKNGTLLDISLTISLIRDAQGRIIGASKVARDITEAKRAENELRRANENLEQFAYSASHDLQEPLRTIKVYSELLALRLGTAVDRDTSQCLEFLRNAATRMELLLRDLLAYAQVTRQAVPPEEVDANEAFAVAVGNLSGAISEAGALVTSDKLPILRAYNAHMRQLFQNLIGNAVKYRSEHRAPVIHIGVERQPGSWVFTVRDNGIGIEPEFRERIFGLFSRAHSPDHYAGTGIGLAICLRIVESYHGRIWVESEPGCGSAFYFSLPA